MIGKIIRGIAKVAEAITDSPVFKAAKFCASATVGIPCAVVATTLGGIYYAGVKTVEMFEKKVIKGVFGVNIIDDAIWEQRLEGARKMMRSIWEDYGVYAHLKTADFIGKTWASRQDEAGYGNSADNLDSLEVKAAKNGKSTHEKLAQMEVGKIDARSLPYEVNNTIYYPSHIPGQPLTAEQLEEQRQQGQHH